LPLKKTSQGLDSAVAVVNPFGPSLAESFDQRDISLISVCKCYDVVFGPPLWKARNYLVDERFKIKP
jgi:hypothetical protein